MKKLVLFFLISFSFALQGMENVEEETNQDLHLRSKDSFVPGQNYYFICTIEHAKESWPLLCEGSVTDKENSDAPKINIGIYKFQPHESNIFDIFIHKSVRNHRSSIEKNENKIINFIKIHEQVIQEKKQIAQEKKKYAEVNENIEAIRQWVEGLDGEAGEIYKKMNEEIEKSAKSHEKYGK